MTVVGIRGPSASQWSVPAATLKNYLEEFLKTSRRPKDFNPTISGWFEDLLVPAIFYASPDPDPSRKDAPKQVRDEDPSYGIGKLIIAIKVLRDIKLVYGTPEEAATRLKKYRRTLQRLTRWFQLKQKDRTEVEELHTFIVALGQRAERVASEERRYPDDDDD